MVSDAPGMSSIAGSQARAVAVAVAGTAAVVAYAVWAATQILVLNPLAAVPGAMLHDIYDEATAAGESLREPVGMFVLTLGPLVAMGWLVGVVRRRDARPSEVAARYLVMLAMGAPMYFVASFGAGMALADTYGIGGADHSPWAGPLYLTSTVALACLLVQQARGAVARRRARGATKKALVP